MNKYNAQKVKVDGKTFDSKMEHRRWEQLLLLEQAGEIRNLVFHPVFQLQPGFSHEGKQVRAISYEGDFLYEEQLPSGIWRLVMEDVKGHQTSGFKLKQKMFWRLYPLYELRIITDV